MFSDRPISDIRRLYGKEHKEAVKELHKLVEKGMFVSLLGPRRVGKTSVLRTFLNTYDYPYLYYDLSPYIGKTGVSYTSLTPSLMNFNEIKFDSEFQINLAIIKLTIKNIQGKQYENALLNVLREVNAKFERFLIIFDEAQVLAFIRGINMLGLLQAVHNTMDHISVIMTGSMPGLLEKILSPSSKKPMYARYIEKIELKRWSKEEAYNYLKTGLEEANIKYSDYELEEAVNELSAVPGFLAFYGLKRLKTDHKEALEDAFENAILLWTSDLDAFINIYKSPTYLTTLSILAQTSLGLTWSEIIREINRFEEIKNPKLYRILKNLTSAGMIEKRNNKYVIAEKPLKEAIIRKKLDTDLSPTLKG